MGRGSSSAPLRTQQQNVMINAVPVNCNLTSIVNSIGSTLNQCTTDLPIKPIYRPINRIGKSEKSQYRIGIGSANYDALNRLIGSSSIKVVSNEHT